MGVYCDPVVRCFANQWLLGIDRFPSFLKVVMVVFLSLTAFGCATPVAESPYEKYKTKTDLIIPLTGVSIVMAAGRDRKYNHHVTNRSQRFAVDIASLSSTSQAKMARRQFNFRAMYKNDKSRNSEYHCFGRLIVAPGSGIVASVVNDVVDNEIVGQRNELYPPGNNVVIDHQNGEFSMLAHFKLGSILVKKGDQVKQGTPLGLCGNSGRSTGPHLHYHLQTTKWWFIGYGLPIQFKRYYSNGKYIESGELRFGRVISNDL